MVFFGGSYSTLNHTLQVFGVFRLGGIELKRGTVRRARFRGSGSLPRSSNVVPFWVSYRGF